MERKIPIFWVRGLPVILDLHLAPLYGVKTKRLNEQVRRNTERFPEDFVFRLSEMEWGELVANCDQFSNMLHSSVLPTAFTEQGALMASTVLRSAQAIQMSLYIVRAFVRMREAMSDNEMILRRLAEINKTLLVHDEGLRDLYQKLLPLLEPGPESEKRKIGFLLSLWPNAILSLWPQLPCLHFLSRAAGLTVPLFFFCSQRQ